MAASLVETWIIGGFSCSSVALTPRVSRDRDRAGAGTRCPQTIRGTCSQASWATNPRPPAPARNSRVWSPSARCTRCSDGPICGSPSDSSRTPGLAFLAAVSFVTQLLRAPFPPARNRFCRNCIKITTRPQWPFLFRPCASSGQSASQADNPRPRPGRSPIHHGVDSVTVKSAVCPQTSASVFPAPLGLADFHRGRSVLTGPIMA